LTFAGRKVDEGRNLFPPSERTSYSSVGLFANRETDSGICHYTVLAVKSIRPKKSARLMTTGMSAVASIAVVYKDAPTGALYWLGIITVLFFVASLLSAAPCGSPFARDRTIIDKMALNE
jgi:hypothetical protein